MSDAETDLPEQILGRDNVVNRIKGPRLFTQWSSISDLLAKLRQHTEGTRPRSRRVKITHQSCLLIKTLRALLDIRGPILGPLNLDSSMPADIHLRCVPQLDSHCCIEALRGGHRVSYPQKPSAKISGKVEPLVHLRSMTTSRPHPGIRKGSVAGLRSFVFVASAER